MKRPFVLALLFGCGASAGSSDAGFEDAGFEDARVADGRDAATVDASPPDADAPSPDASALDAGTSPDAATVLPPSDARPVVVDGENTFAEVAAGVAPGEWVRYETSAEAGYFDNGEGGHDLSWGDSAVYDSVSGCVMHYGGGHLVVPGFSLYCTRTNTWVRGPLPPWLDLEGDVWGYTNHGYDRNAFDPATRRLFFYRGREVWVFELETERWSRHSLAIRNAYLRDFATFVPGVGVIAGRGENDARLFVIDPNDGGTTLEAESAFHSALHTFGEYSPVHDVLFYGGGDERREVYVRDARGSRRVADAPEVPRTVASGAAGAWVTTDPDDGDFLVLFAPTGELHRYDPTDDTWRLESRSPFEPGLSRTVASSLPDHGVVLFATRAGTGSATITLYRPR